MKFVYVIVRDGAPVFIVDVEQEAVEWCYKEIGKQKPESILAPTKEEPRRMTLRWTASAYAIFRVPFSGE